MTERWRLRQRRDGDRFNAIKGGYPQLHQAIEEDIRNPDIYFYLNELGHLFVTTPDDPLANHSVTGISTNDLIAAARYNRIDSATASELYARLNFSYWYKDGNLFYNNLSELLKRDYLGVAYRVLYGQEWPPDVTGCFIQIPYSLALCFMAICDFGVSPNVDPKTFTPRGAYLKYGKAPYPYACGYTERGRELAARLVGSVLVETTLGDEKAVFMRERRQKPCQGYYGLPGGKSDRLAEVTGLEEVVEEMELPKDLISRAVPLAVTEQWIGDPTEQSNQLPSHYLNYVWKITLPPADLEDHYPVDGDGGGNWELFTESQLRHKAKSGLLSPIVLCSLVAAGYLDIKDYPIISRSR